MTIDDLRDERKLAWQRVKRTHSLLIRAERLYKALKASYEKDEAEYERVDHEMAIIDGRLEKVAPATTKTRKPKIEVDLTAEQIIKIAASLGIKLEEPEEVPEPEDIDLEELEDVTEG